MYHRSCLRVSPSISSCAIRHAFPHRHNCINTNLESLTFISGLCLRGSPGLFDGLPPPPAGRLGLGCAGRRRWTSDGRLLLLAAARSSTAPRFLLNPTPVRQKDLGWQQADPVLQWVTAQWDFLRSGSSFSLTRSPGGTWVSW